MRNEFHFLFYLPPEKINGDPLTITGEEAHHLRNVLRKKTGDVLELTDGLGSRIEAKVLKTDPRGITARVLKRERIASGPIPVLDLALAPLKGTRTDLIVEKGTELGVRRFVFFTSDNSVVKEMTGGRMKRYHKIALSAMLQSRRYWLPEFVVLGRLPDLLTALPDYDMVLVADPSGRPDVPAGKNKILFVVGPEGGFGEKELSAFKKVDALPVSLGPVRLRSETAALAGIAKILTAYKLL